jgi:DNA-binding response OmpR family regulator
MARILVIDDERLICDMLRTVLTQRKHDVFTALGGAQALQLFRERRPQFTLLDLRMPDMNGIEVLKEIRKIDLRAPVMVLTGWGTDEMEKDARALGVSDFVCKGLSLEMLVTTVDRILQRQNGNKLLELINTKAEADASISQNKKERP